MRTTAWPTAPWLSPPWPDSHTNMASPSAPTALAAHTTTQLRSNSPVLMRPPAQAMASRLLPVNSSAPATVTRMSPSENTSPPSSREAAKPRLASLATSV